VPHSLNSGDQVIAHELGHLKCEHGVFITMANLLTIVTESLPFVSLFSDVIRCRLYIYMYRAKLELLERFSGL